jgi:hypothetical protein
MSAAILDHRRNPIGILGYGRDHPGRCWPQISRLQPRRLLCRIAVLIAVCALSWRVGFWETIALDLRGVHFALNPCGDRIAFSQLDWAEAART